VTDPMNQEARATELAPGHALQATRQSSDATEYGPNGRPGRTVQPRRSTLLREASDRQPAPLSDSEVSSLLQSLGARDLAILTALHQYRYLDLGQLMSLFFSDRRSCQSRLKKLRESRLVHRWLRIERPGRRCSDSVFLLSRPGATLLADWRNENKDAFIRRADEAWNKCFHVLHDLEANGFFIEIATASSQIPFEGLYHWAGEATARAIYRQQKAALAPDGWGRYLHPGKEISFFLEWDRATESPHRLRAKVMTYVTHFASVGEFAGLHNVIFVAPTEVREDAIQGVIETCLQSVASTCSFWTTHVELVQAVGALGRVWRGVGAGERICLTELPSAPRSKRPAGDCIAKPQWWVRRPGGGEVA